MNAISSFFNSGRVGGGLDGFFTDFFVVSYIGRNFKVIDSIWIEGRFHKRLVIKVRRWERSGGPIMRCRDWRLVKAGRPRAAKSVDV